MTTHQGELPAASIDIKFGHCLTWSKVIDNIEISIDQEVTPNGYVIEDPEPFIGICYTVVERETGIEDDVTLNYEGDLWGLQPA